MKMIDIGILLREATSDDCRELWLWRNHPAVRRGLFEKTTVSWVKHRAWFYSKIKDEARKIYIATIDNDKVGNIRFEEITTHIYVSINLNPQFLDRGLGSKIIELGTKKFREETKIPKQIIAKIKEDNIPSLGAFFKAGYKFLKRIDNAFFYVYR